MSPLTVAIDRCRSAIRLRRDAAGDRTRLMQLHRAALGDPLERALEAAGVREDRLVCIRRLEVSLRLTPTATDAALVQHLADVVASALVEASERGDAVVYRSRVHAVADLVTRAADGDLGRVWAWRQLGLWEDAAPAPGSAVLLALLGESAAIAPILAGLAVRPPRLARLSAAIGAGGWRVLARAALGAAGAAHDLAERARAAITLGAPDERADRSAPAVTSLAPWRGRVDAVLRRQPLAAGLARLPGGPTPAQAAALALLYADPVLLTLTAHPLELLRAAAVVVEEIARVSAPPRAGGGDTTRLGAERPSPAVSREAAPTTMGDDAHASTPPTNERARPASDLDAGARAAVPGPGAPPAGPTDAEVAAPVAADARARGTTACGGLVFLLHLVPDVVLPRAVEAGPLAGRPLRWTLWRLARLLEPALSGDDPAALAWAGLPPNAPLPDAEAPEPTAEEHAELRALADALGVALCERLGRSPSDAPAAVGETTRRRALIVADPGWLEVRLALDEVSTSVRAAGLDCDPGWLPWLGVVVRIVYE